MNALETIQEQITDWIHGDSQEAHEREYNQNPSYRNLDDEDRAKYVYELMKQDKGQLRLMSLLKFIMEEK